MRQLSLLILSRKKFNPDVKKTLDTEALRLCGSYFINYNSAISVTLEISLVCPKVYKVTDIIGLLEYSGVSLTNCFDSGTISYNFLLENFIKESRMPVFLHYVENGKMTPTHNLGDSSPVVYFIDLVSFKEVEILIANGDGALFNNSYILTTNGIRKEVRDTGTIIYEMM